VADELEAGAAVADGVEAGDLDLRFLGPLITVENVEDHLPLLANVFGLEPRAIQELDPAEVQAIWGVEGRSAGSVLLETGESRVGARLIQFAPTGGRPLPAVRRPASEPNAPRELQFLTRDFEVARHVIERAGFSFRSIARYSAPSLGRFTEAKLLGPEGLSYSVLRMHDRPMEPWVRITDRLFGELLGVSIAVHDLEAAAAFYELLGLRRVSKGPRSSHRDHEAGDAAVPADAVAEAPAGVEESQETLSFGSEPRAPLVTLVAGAAPSPGHASSLEESLVARHGVVALRFQSASIEPIRRRLWSVAGQRTGARVLALGRGILEPMGAVESMLVRGPGGVLHQFLGRL
jgi:catechol 2,3-dioxygenase-like lactoylglutathione lyase family enzyme